MSIPLSSTYISLGPELTHPSYLVLMRPPTRELCLDALEDLYRNGACYIYFYVFGVIILTRFFYNSRRSSSPNDQVAPEMEATRSPRRSETAATGEASISSH